MNIATFLSQIAKGGLARASHFEVFVLPPAGIGGTASQLTYRCQDIIIPGRSIDSLEPPTMVVPRSFGYRGAQDTVTASFLCSENLAEREFFLNWQDKIVNKYRKTNGAVTNGMFDVGYYDDYRGQVEIRKYTETGNLSYTCKLIDAWPKAVNGLSVAWENGDQFLIQTVQFQYWMATDGNGLTYETDEDGNTIVSGVA